MKAAKTLLITSLFASDADDFGISPDELRRVLHCRKGSLHGREVCGAQDLVDLNLQHPGGFFLVDGPFRIGITLGTPFLHVGQAFVAPKMDDFVDWADCRFEVG